MCFDRRTMLAALAGGLAMSATAPTVAGDDSTKGDALPNGNVPDAEVYAFPPEDKPLQVKNGNWITFSNGWISTPITGEECTLERILNNSTQTFNIDDETFVLNSFDDWEFDDDIDEMTEDPESGEELEIFCRAMFSHSLSPKPPGETFTVRWEFEIDDEEAFKDGNPYPFFPLENEVEVISRGGH